MCPRGAIEGPVEVDDFSMSLYDSLYVFKGLKPHGTQGATLSTHVLSTDLREVDQHLLEGGMDLAVQVGNPAEKY